MTPELLAPAGSPEALRAAVCAGADAVYLGAASFGARASAGFSREELRDGIRFAHFHGRRIYVTVNTLVKDGEWADLRAALRELGDLRADAVLIQDLGVWRLCRDEFPELTLHASTQMSLHTPSGVRWAAEHGISRVVLHREATIGDIREAVGTGVEIEVFAHGALCVSVSGQCALSASLGERSGNRGRCAQPCRLNYRYRDRERAWLSPADLCTLPVLRELTNAGVASLKIEGRLKRPEYVFIVTDIYRRALDRLALQPGNTLESTADTEALRQIFCRGRFTRGYAGGEQDAGILNPGHTAHEGLQIGKVREVSVRKDAALAQVTLTRPLRDQDGLSVGDDRCVYTGPGAVTGQTATLRLHRSVPIGTPVMRTESALQLEEAREMYGKSALSRLRRPVSMSLYAAAGQPSLLRLESQGITVDQPGPVAAAAERKPLTDDIIRQAMFKTGDAPFYLDGIDTCVHNAYLSSAQLNAMRREGLEKLEDAVILDYESRQARKSAQPPRTNTQPKSSVSSGRWHVRTEESSEVRTLLEAGADHVLLFLRDLREGPLRQIPWAELSGQPVTLMLPPSADDGTLQRLAEAAARHGLTLGADNAGQLRFSPMIRLTAEGIPVFNSRTESVLRSQGVEAAVLSPELSGKEIAAMPAPQLERILCVYGRQRLMLLHHCPERVFKALSSGHEQCRLCESGHGLAGQCLTDRKGLRLPLLPYRTDSGCMVRLYSGAPLSLLSCMPEVRRLPCSFLISFTDEPAEARPAILKAFKEGAPFRVEGTAGKYPAGVL